jgi:hypothetical protein
VPPAATLVRLTNAVREGGDLKIPWRRWLRQFVKAQSRRGVVSAKATVGLGALGVRRMMRSQANVMTVV